MEWNIEVVNHLWLEESYKKRKAQAITNSCFNYYPPQLNSIVGCVYVNWNCHQYVVSLFKQGSVNNLTLSSLSAVKEIQEKINNENDNNSSNTTTKNQKSNQNYLSNITSNDSDQVVINELETKILTTTPKKNNYNHILKEERNENNRIYKNSNSESPLSHQKILNKSVFDEAKQLYVSESPQPTFHYAKNILSNENKKTPLKNLILIKDNNNSNQSPLQFSNNNFLNITPSFEKLVKIDNDKNKDDKELAITKININKEGDDKIENKNNNSSIKNNKSVVVSIPISTVNDKNKIRTNKDNEIYIDVSQENLNKFNKNNIINKIDRKKRENDDTIKEADYKRRRLSSKSDEISLLKNNGKDLEEEKNKEILETQDTIVESSQETERTKNQNYMEIEEYQKDDRIIKNNDFQTSNNSIEEREKNIKKEENENENDFTKITEIKKPIVHSSNNNNNNMKRITNTQITDSIIDSSEDNNKISKNLIHDHNTNSGSLKLVKKEIQDLDKKTNIMINNNQIIPEQNKDMTHHVSLYKHSVDELKLIKSSKENKFNIMFTGKKPTADDLMVKK